MNDSLILAALLGLAAWGWLAALGASERAHQHARAICAQAGLQLLDQSVSLSALKFARDTTGMPVLILVYRFEISRDGSDRCRGSLSTLHGELIGYILPDGKSKDPRIT